MIDGIYIRLALIALLLGAGTFGGCQLQGRIDRGKIERKDKALTQASTDLRAAKEALSGNAERFRDIDAVTAENERLAKEQRERSDKSAADARAAERATALRVAELEEKLEAEKSTCTDGRRPICGLPLR